MTVSVGGPPVVTIFVLMMMVVGVVGGVSWVGVVGGRPTVVGVPGVVLRIGFEPGKSGRSLTIGSLPAVVL
jgi:hypothetical protein